MNSLTAFLNEDGELLTAKMHPLGLLRGKIKKYIQEKNREAAKLAEGLDVSQIDPDYEALSIENHVKSK